jgi:LysW-gamma-L-lysine carboxypeptidase
MWDTLGSGDRVRPLTTRRAVDLLRCMLETPSPSGEEGRLARLLCDQARGLGLETRIDRAGNLVAETGIGGGPAVLLLGHMDTIPGTVPVRVERGRLYGRGAVDAKGPLAAMLCAAAASAGLPARLTVVAAVEEETPQSRGAVHLLDTVAPPDLLVIGEPGGWTSVVIGYKGKLDLEYRVRRPATHPSNPVEKAAEAAVGFWSDLLDLLGPRRSHAAFGQPAATLLRVAGGMEEATLAVDCRLPPGFDDRALVEALRARAHGGEVRVIHSVPAVLAERSNPVARSLSASIRRHGAVPVPKVKTATSDMNTVAERWRPAMAAYGPGDSTLDHTGDEHVEIEEYLSAVSVLAGALEELADEPVPEQKVTTS